MIGYAMLGANDTARAKAFYDPIMKLLGAEVLAAYSSEKRVFYSAGAGQPMLAVGLPWDGHAASAGNGTMIALAAPSRAVVDKAHASALAQGGKDEGAPGVRGSNPNGFYGAYFRDLDGNKICVFRIGPPDAK
jgi:catechol 2,3-dioxygenase-like lactoylglutathione lyase family enzyme